MIAFLTPAELVERWNGTVTRNTLANWRAQSKGPPFVKIGSRVVYRVSDLEAWERNNTTGGDATAAGQGEP